MELIDLIKKRYSVRDFLDKKVEETLILKVLEAGRCAPSACNNQPWIFIVIVEQDSRRKLETVYNREWFLNAPVIIAACCDRSASWKRNDGKDYGDVDIAIALDHMVLTATELGLASCWVGAFKPQEAKKVLMIPEHVEPIAFIPIGYAVTDVPQKTRKPLNEFVFWDFYGRRKR